MNNGMKNHVTVGYPIIAENTSLLKRFFFPSKIGGKPAWLDPVNLPNGDTELYCFNCKQPLTFILQLYAPRDSDDSFHRSIFLFGCCDCGDYYKALRCQLPLINEYYPPYPLDTSSDHDLEDDCINSKCCYLCGIPTSYRLNLNNTDSMDHDLINYLREKISIANSSMPLPHKRCIISFKFKSIPTVFPEQELDIDSITNQSLTDADLEHETILYNKYKLVESSKSEHTLDNSQMKAMQQITHKEKESSNRAFRKFVQFMEKYNYPVLRYVVSGIKKPLWSSQSDISLLSATESQLKCLNCGGSREFEFQVHSNLITHLKTNRFNFSILSIYTCSQNCVINKDSSVDHLPNHSTYIEEVVIVEKDHLDD